jgi:Fe(3+) dicitrate transport protein
MILRMIRKFIFVSAHFWCASEALADPLNSIDGGFEHSGVSLESTSIDEALGDAVADAGVSKHTRETRVVGQQNLSPRRVAGSAQVLTAEQLERREANDMHRVLDEVPGVSTRDEDGFGLRPNIGIRGAQSDRSSKVALLEDGILFAPAPYSAPAAYYFPMVTRMASVEVYKGPASIRFGPQTLGGAIQLHTRDISPGLQFLLDVSYGSFNTAKAHGLVSQSSEQLGILLEFARLSSTGFKVLDGGGDTGFSRQDAMAKAFWRHGIGTLTLKGSYGDEVSNETYLGLSDADFRATPYRRYAASAPDQMRWGRWSGVVTERLSFSRAVQWSTSIYRSQLDRTWRRVNGFRGRSDLSQVLAGIAPGPTANYIDVLRGTRDSLTADEDVLQVSNRRQFVSQGIDSTFVASFSTGLLSHEMNAGFRFHHDSIARNHTGRYFRTADGKLMQTDDEEVVLTDNLAFSRALSGFVTDSIRIRNLMLVPGLRVEQIWMTADDRLQQSTGASTQTAVLPGFGAVLALPFQVDVLAGVHRGFSPVAPGQSGLVLPEFAWNFESGARLSGKHLRAEAIGFLSIYSNLLGTCTLSSGCLEEETNRQFNGGRVLLGGVEASVKAQRRIGWGLTGHLSGTYTLTASRFLSSFVSADPSWGTVRSGDALPLIAPHRGNVEARLEHERFEIGAGVSFQSEMRQVAGQDTPRDAERIPGRALLDAYAAYQLSDAVRIYATGTNLTNSTNLGSRAPFGARPLAPMQLTIGVKVSLQD